MGAPPQPPERNQSRRGVVFVHGVGGQRKSETLLTIGDPLFDWLQRWSVAFGKGPGLRMGHTQLSFAPVDVGQSDLPSWTRYEFQDQVWSIAEVWWAESNRKPDLTTMLAWSWEHLWDITDQLRRSVGERVDRLLHPEGHPTQPARWVQLIDLLNCVGLLVVYPVAAVLGYALLIPLTIAAQIPIEAFQNWVLLRLITPLLVVNAGEFRMFLQDEIQSANVRRRAAGVVEWLVRNEHCDEITIVAHSEGCVVSFGMLIDPVFAAARRSVRKLITIGEGINKSWLIRPDLERLHGPLSGNILWVDIWASYDPVPAGPLDPPRGVHIYAPTGEAARQTGDRHGPVSVQVTNEMNVISDHNAYWRNDEQVLSRLAAEIDCFDHTQSQFWAADWAKAARERRERISIIALLRAIAVAGFLVGTAIAWLQLALRGVAPTTGLQDVPGTWWLSWPIQVLLGLDTLGKAVLPPAAGLVEQILAFPAYGASAFVIAVGWWAAYHLARRFYWDPWDRRARDHIVAASAHAARAEADIE